MNHIPFLLAFLFHLALSNNNKNQDEESINNVILLLLSRTWPVMELKINQVNDPGQFTAYILWADKDWAVLESLYQLRTDDFFVGLCPCQRYHGIEIEHLIRRFKNTKLLT